MEKYLLDKWTETEKELMRERGLWGPPVGSELDKWMLDMTEGPCRMRKKMMKNDMFYIHYPFRPEISDTIVSSCAHILTPGVFTNMSFWWMQK